MVVRGSGRRTFRVGGLASVGYSEGTGARSLGGEAEGVAGIMALLSCRSLVSCALVVVCRRSGMFCLPVCRKVQLMSSDAGGVWSLGKRWRALIAESEQNWNGRVMRKTDCGRC